MALAGGGDATTFQLSGPDVCELQRHDPRQGPPGWLSYVSVDDPGAMCLNHQSWAAASWSPR